MNKEIKIDQENILNCHVRAILSHAMLGDDYANEMKRETFDLCVSEICAFILKEKKQAYHEGAELIEP